MKAPLAHLPRRSSHFFISGNNPIAKLPDYLETMLAKMAKEMPGVAGKEGAASNDTEEVGGGCAPCGDD